MANALIPVPRSYSQVLGDSVDVFLSHYGINSIKIASPILSIFEATSQSQLRSSEDIFTLLQSTTLQNASGSALDRIGADEDAPRLTQTAANGFVNFGDNSFVKISSKIFQGTPAPIIGTTAINVQDAVLFPSTGSVYIGRGTQNYEGPIPYSSVTNNGTYWTVNLTQPTVLFHNQNETVIVAQGGNRAIPASTTVQTQQGATASALSFTTLYAATIPDGEVLISNVVVVSQVPGTSGNVSKGSIQQFITAPFTGATVTNPLPFTNGIDTENDDTYKDRIRLVRQSRAKATSTAITTNAIGITSTDDNKRVTSASVVEVEGQTSTLYIDDGTGYEEISSGIAIETFSDYALGGEQSFQVSATRPVTKAFVEAINGAPWVMTSGMQLAMTVGGVQTSHTFDETEFRNISNATSYEVVTSINNDSSLLWSARTTQNGSSFAVFAKADTNEDIQLATPNGIDANTVFNLPSGRVDTMALYKNDRLLNKDGQPARIAARSLAQWSTLSGDQTLVITVDNIEMSFDGVYTSANHFAPFTSQDFIDAETGFTSLGINTAEAWAAVFNYRIPGITASIANGLIVLTSNKGSSTKSEIAIISGTLVTNHMFDPSSNVGQNSDYTLNRNTGMFTLNTPLAIGDKLSAGSASTRAFLQTPSYTGTVNVPAPANLWFSVDGNAEVIATGLTASSPIQITVPFDDFWSNKVRVSSTTSTSLFSNVEVGDWVVFADANLLGISSSYKVSGVDPGGTYFDVQKKAMAQGRYGFASCKLADGTIFVCGGFGGANSTEVVNSAEIFNPTLRTWTSVPNMGSNRVFHTATLLANGDVLVVGGSTSGTDASALFTSEIYNPFTTTWIAGPSFGATGFSHHSAIQLGTGFTTKTLVIGGRGSTSTYLTACWLYDDVANTAVATGSLNFAHAFHTTNRLAGGTVIVAGGQNAGGVIADTQIYTPGSGLWATGSPLNTARSNAAAVVMSTGNILITGGSSAIDSLSDVLLNSTEIYAAGTWTTSAVMNSTVARHALVAITDTSVVRLGGHLGTPADQVEVYNGATWSVGALPIDCSPVIFSRIGVGAYETTANNVLMFAGKSASAPFYNWATAEIYNKTANTWSIPDSASESTFTLASSGISFVRTSGPLEHVVIPAGSSYSAPTLVDALNAYLYGAKASVYRTTSIRVNTNTFAKTNGSIALIMADANSNLIKLPVATVLNSFGHLASAESGNSELGTPDFHQSVVTGSASPSQPYVTQSTGGSSQSPLFVSESIVGLRDRDVSLAYSNYGNNYGFHSHIASYLDTLVNLREGVDSAWAPQDRIYFASTYSIGPNDSLTVVANEDPTNSRFTIPMYRNIYPINATYGSQNTFRDADNSNASLATAFGLNYSFDDFAVFMNARVKSDPSTANKTVVWRNVQMGPDGNSTRIHYGLPSGPNQAVSVTVDPTTTVYTDVSVNLASGALRTGVSIQPTNLIGLACTSISAGLASVDYILGFPIASASRTANVTTLTLTLPSGVTDHGLTAGTQIYVASTNVNFTSGAYTLLSGSGSTVTYTETAANQGATANIGTVSNGSSAFTLSGSTVVVNDFFRLRNALGITTPSYADFTNQTMRIATIPNFQTIKGVLENFTAGVNTTVNWYVVQDTAAFQAFVNSQNTAAQIVTAVNALDSSAVTAALGGSGAGVIFKSSAEDNAQSPFWYQMTDGLNYVESTVSPISLSGDYQLVFKLPVSAALATSSDWADEKLRLVPVTNKNIVQWFNTPAVTGLWTDCAIENSSQGNKVQINSLTAGSAGAVQVQGGTANNAAAPVIGAAFEGSGYSTVNVDSNLTDGFFGGMWVAINNDQALPKAIFDSGTILNTITNNVDQTATFILNGSSTPIFTERNSPTANAVLQIEGQGNFSCYSSTALGTLNMTSVQEGDYVYIASPAAPSGGFPLIDSINAGIFRIVRVDNTGLDGSNGSFWVENLDSDGANRVEGQSLAQCDVIFFTPDSMMPGDKVSISTTLWGATNKGIWTVTSVGRTSSNTGPAFGNAFSFQVDVSTTSIADVVSSPGPLGIYSGLVQDIEGIIGRFIKRILAISPSADDPGLAVIKFDSSQSAGRINATAGSVINALDKLAFDTSVVTGIDGYRHSVGLIGAVARVILGDPADPVTYPGIQALGTKLNFSGPLIQRVEISLQLRIATGVQVIDVENLVRSAVASVINNNPIGHAISFSDVIDAAATVQGVVSVVIVSPTYNSSNDVINVPLNVKTLVLSDSDILISFIGN